jgi:2,4-dienoyl-CoA reductase-like NADH-dependent reductase (Old Yellow Enzyme family)
MNCDDGVEGGIDIDSFPALAREIEKAGVQAIEVSGNNAARQSSAAEGQSYFLKYVERLELKVPVILTGGNRSIERLEQIFKTGKPDFFGLARPLVREPDLPNRWLEGRGGPESTCTSCNRCLTTLGKGEATRCRAQDRGAG